jgi:hypothetical protein
MATILPDGWQALPASASLQREIQTLHQLDRGLPAAYTVLHGVHWTRLQEGHQVFGEVDFVVVGPSGRVLLIEQKSGFLDETPEGLAKTYGERDKNVPAQMARTATALDARLRQSVKGPRAPLETLLYCPDYTVRRPGTAGLDPARIVDATRRDQLCTIIRGILPAEEPAFPERTAVVRFFAGLLDLVPESGAIAGQAQALYTRLAGGLTEWARRIECEPHRLRVSATAGSGKTQLALALLGDAVGAGRRALYVCYNRPLADHIAVVAPPGATVATYHQLCDRIARAGGRKPDFGSPGAFTALEAAFDAHEPAAGPHYDDVIVDEGQDFEPAWAANVLKLLAPAARAWWLEDPMQNLYGRAAVPLSGWVRLTAATNYRSPRAVLAALNRLVEPSPPVIAGSPIVGTPVELLTYTDTKDLIRQTTRAITNAIAAGFSREAIAVVTLRGREHSALSPYDRIGPYALRTYTGRYDLLGNAERTEGEVVVDSVHRFKGQSAPCVVLTEIDFAGGEMDENFRRRLFVGATRATLRLTLVVSERAAPLLQARLANPAA